MENRGIYRHAECYDIAFGFRDIGAECEFLRAIFQEHGRGADSFLECACGPGQHALEMARRGLPSVGVDLCGEMVSLLDARAHKAGLPARGMQGDMRALDLGERFDGAALLMDSVSHLLTNEEMVMHLDSVARHLREGGVYVLEMAHPSNHFGVAKTADNVWSMERDGVTVATQWGLPEDRFDSLTQIDEVTVIMEVTRSGGETERHVDHMRTRRWTKPHFEALVALSGSFDIVAWFGALKPDVPLGHEKEAWRMVPVLRKRDHAGTE